MCIYQKSHDYLKALKKAKKYLIVFKKVFGALCFPS